MQYYDYHNDYLMHHGVKGMKWGVRKKRNAFSVKAAGHKFSAKTMGVYESMNRKMGNKTSANAFRVVKEGQLKKAEQAQAAANQRREQKRTNRSKVSSGKSTAEKTLAKTGSTKYKDYQKNAVSLKAAGHKAYAKMFEINENYYGKRNNELYRSMNADAKAEQLRKAEQAQADANRRRYNR